MSLTASRTTITAPGQAVELTWRTRNATSATINNGVGRVTPTAGGSVTVRPTESTTYVLTAGGADNSTDKCQVSVTLKEAPPPPPVARCVSLTASRTTITEPGQAVTLTWRTQNANTVTLSGFGAVEKNGSRVVRPNGTTTYTLQVNGANTTDDCVVRVVLDVPPPPENARCVSLTASETTIEEGEEITLSWRTENATSITINNGIGSVRPVAAGSIRVSPDDDTTYVATVRNATQSDNCEVSVNVREDRDRPDRPDRDHDRDRPDRDRDEPDVFIDSDIDEAAPPLGSVYLSELPYTGLDLGPFGTLVYWLMLVLWSLAAAYLVLFVLVPYLFRREVLAQAAQSSGTLPGWGPANDEAPAPAVRQVAQAAAVAHAMPEPLVASAAPAAAPSRPAPATQSEGFRAFAENKGTLTIDDIVKGLSRESGMVFAPSERAPEQGAYAQPQAAEPRIAPVELPSPSYSDDIPGFIESLLEGDRDRVFGTVRTIAKEGGDPEHFLTQAVCALDDAYRAKAEGAEVHPEIARVTKDCHPSFLERLVTSLATAVDSSYSAGVTGTKLALTRALAVVNG